MADDTKKKRPIANTEDDGPYMDHDDIMKQMSPEAGARYEAQLDEIVALAKSTKPKAKD